MGCQNIHLNSGEKKHLMVGKKARGHAFGAGGCCWYSGASCCPSLPSPEQAKILYGSIRARNYWQQEALWPSSSWPSSAPWTSSRFRLPAATSVEATCVSRPATCVSRPATSPRERHPVSMASSSSRTLRGNTLMARAVLDCVHQPSCA